MLSPDEFSTNSTPIFDEGITRLLNDSVPLNTSFGNNYGLYDPHRSFRATGSSDSEWNRIEALDTAAANIVAAKRQDFSANHNIIGGNAFDNWVD